MDQAATLAKWLLGAFEAVELNYLKELSFVVYLDKSKPEEVHEKYTFGFTYKDGVANMTNGKVSMKDLKGDTQTLLRQMGLVIQGLEKLPDEAYLALVLTYYEDVTPEDYEPEGFTADHSVESPMPPRAYRVSLGGVKTSFHGLKVKLAAREQGARGGYVNNTYVASDTESPSQSQSLLTQASGGEEFSQSQPLSEVSLLASHRDQVGSQLSDTVVSSPCSPASTVKLEEVSCVCLSTTRDPLMLLCTSCSTLQHAACYRLLSRDDLPSEHTCWDCSKRLNIPCTDPRMDKFEGQEEKAVATCNYRRVLALLFNRDDPIITPQMIQTQLDMSEEEGHRLMDKLVHHGAVTEDSGRFLINGGGLEAMIRKFLGIKMKLSKRQSSTKDPKRTRKEESDSESRKIKKSKSMTISM